MTKCFKPTSFLALLGSWFLLLYLLSCNNEPNKVQDKKPWHHKDVMPTKLKWFLNSNNYTDSNYNERFKTYYQEFLSQNHTDSALYCLLAYGEMIDQNYLYDTFYLHTAKEHLKKYEPISTEEGELIKLYYYIGSQYEANSEYKLAEEWFNNGIKHPNVLPRTKIKCLGMLSEIYKDQRQPERALPLQLERLTFYEKEKDTINVGVTYSNIANIYNVLNAYQLAIDYELKAIQHARLKNDSNTLIPFISNYLIFKKNSQAEFKLTDDFIRYANELNATCAAYSKLSPYNEWVRLDINFDIYAKQNKLDSMRLTIEQIKVLNEILHNPSLNNKAEYLESIYREKCGLPLLNKNELEELANNYEKNELWTEARRTNIVLFTEAKKNGDNKSALKYFEKIFDIEKQEIKQNNKGQVYEMDIKYQTAKKDQEILIQAEKLKIKQRNIGLLIAGLVIAVLAFVVYFIWLKKKIIIEKRKTETLFTQKLMENTEDERMRIAKDLHDSIGHELLNVKSAISNKLQFTEDKIDHILAEIREISRNLFPVMFEEVGLKISVEQLIEQITKSEDLYVIGEINYIAGTLDTKAELNIYRIIQEALSNVRKYAKAQSAKVSINQTTNSIDVEIIDNGKGFDVMEILKQGKAFGLMSINQRCLALKSAVSIESSSNGTVISFQIKL